MKSAFTLVEVIVTVIIIGILAVLAIPQFTKAVEATKAREAVAALQQIRTGERVYRMEADTYFYSSASGDKERIEELNSNLRLYLNTGDGRNWNYVVGVGEAQGTTFDATAARRGGSLYNGRTITIDERGDLGGTWPPELRPEQ